MSYMVMQRITTAVRDGYAGHPAAELATEAEAARRARDWLSSLAIEEQLRGAIVEPVAAIADALEALIREAAAAEARAAGDPRPVR